MTSENNVPHSNGGPVGTFEEASDVFDDEIQLFVPNFVSES